MWLGSLALAGIPPFAGFFSKDLILESAFMAPGGGGWPFYLLGTLAAMLTAVYGFRVIFLAFHSSGEDAPVKPAGKNAFHAHESPWVMLLPMLPLAAGAVAAGYALLPLTQLEWWRGALAIAPGHTALHAAHHAPAVVKFLPLVLAIGGITLSYYMFAAHRSWGRRAAGTFSLAYAVSLNKWYVDELYAFAVVRPIQGLARLLATWGDARGVDGLVNGAAHTVRGFALWLRGAQTGYVYHYAFAMLLAVTVGLGLLLWKAL